MKINAAATNLGLCVVLFACMSTALSQEAVEMENALPQGMSTVLQHYGLASDALPANWRELAPEAVWVSQGWFIADELKADVEKKDFPVFDSRTVGAELLARGISPSNRMVAYPTVQGTWVVLNSSEMISLWTDRYMLNVQSQLR